MNLYDLALSCLMFDVLDGYNVSYSELVRATGGRVDLNDPTHRQDVLSWLNKWGCRHLAKEHHHTASASLFAWYSEGATRLFSEDRLLMDLTEQDIAAATFAYGALKDKIGAWGSRNGTTHRVRVGPTAASKVLYSLRPKALPAWDVDIKDALGCDGSPDSYSRFLLEARSQAREVTRLCQELGLDISDLPAEVGQSRSTVAELINKYMWVAHTRKWMPPSAATMAKWAGWGAKHERPQKQ